VLLGAAYIWSLCPNKTEHEEPVIANLVGEFLDAKRKHVTQGPASSHPCHPHCRVTGVVALSMVRHRPCSILIPIHLTAIVTRIPAQVSTARLALLSSLLVRWYASTLLEFAPVHRGAIMASRVGAGKSGPWFLKNPHARNFLANRPSHEQELGPGPCSAYSRANICRSSPGCTADAP
jgi:hypothetical protein